MMSKPPHTKMTRNDEERLLLISGPWTFSSTDRSTGTDLWPKHSGLLGSSEFQPGERLGRGAEAPVGAGESATGSVEHRWSPLSRPRKPIAQLPSCLRSMYHRQQLW